MREREKSVGIGKSSQIVRGDGPKVASVEVVKLTNEKVNVVR